ncbi:MAG TPA: hypothetical protein VMS17_06310, partial [Gemmataceae bacterium]|nr:hypothetical protein [Gemmataceae bacterium]
HIVGQEPRATERQVARLLLERPELEARYGGWLASLHPAAWREVEAMARTAGKKFEIDLRPAIEYLGLKQVVEQVGLARVIEEFGAKQVVEQLGGREVVKQLGLDGILASLSPAERRELKRRLQ